MSQDPNDTGILPETPYRDVCTRENTLPAFWHHGNLVIEGEPTVFGYIEITAAPKGVHGQHADGSRSCMPASDASSIFVGGRYELSSLALTRVHASLATGEAVLERDHVKFRVEVTVRRPVKNSQNTT